jgi:hypothetical protein
MTIHPHSEEELLAQRGGEIVRAAAVSVSAPIALRERLERDRAQARPSRRRRRTTLAAALVGSLAIVALIVALVAPGTTPAGPTVVQAALLGMQPATGPAPAQDVQTPNHVAVREGKVHFPYWTDDVFWSASGVRTDRLAGHHVTTVFYDDALTGSMRVAYTVVSHPGLKVPKGRQIGRYTVLRHGDHTIVTWREHDQTCILSARNTDTTPANLVRLARQDADI